MHRLPVELLNPKMQLGRHLYNHRGDVLLAGGTELTEAFIVSIRQRGYHFVYIMDGIADDIEPSGLISQRLDLSQCRDIAPAGEKPLWVYLPPCRTVPGRDST